MKKILLGILVGLGLTAGIAFATGPVFRPDQMAPSPCNGCSLQTNGTSNTWAIIPGTGTVTSVSATTSTSSALSVSGVPITSSGTMTISLQAGYNIPLTASTTNWNTLFNTLGSLTLPIPIANGGTGTTTPGLIAGTNITLSGSWPFQTVNASAGTLSTSTVQTMSLLGLQGGSYNIWTSGFVDASTSVVTSATTTNLGISGIVGKLLATDANGVVVATSSYLTAIQLQATGGAALQGSSFTFATSSAATALGSGWTVSSSGSTVTYNFPNNISGTTIWDANFNATSSTTTTLSINGVNTVGTLDKSFQVASNTIDTFGISFNAGTSTWLAWNPSYAVKLKQVYCKTDSGNVWLSVGTGAATSTPLMCTSGGNSASQTATFAANADFNVVVGGEATTTPNRVRATFQLSAQ